jgi:glycine oxidase
MFKDTADVVVVGAGIIGCAAAFELARRGTRVTVVDPRGVARGATFASAGVLAPYVEADANSPLLGLGVRSLAMFDSFVASVATASNPVEYARIGTLEVATDDENLKGLRAQCPPLPAQARMLGGDEARATEPALSSAVMGGLAIEDHAYVAAADLAGALSEAARREGAIFTDPTTVARIDADGGGVAVAIAGGTVHASHAVLAAGTWSGRVQIAASSPLPVRPVRGQLVRLRWPAEPLKTIVWSSRCYVVPWKNGSTLVGATSEDVGFDERATVAGVRDLLDAVCEVLPAAWGATFDEVRVGLRPASPDGLPIVGRSTRVPGLVYATAHYRNGILLAPLTAALVADLILEEREDPALEVLTPGRFGDY